MTFMQGLHGLNVTDHTYSRENITRDAGVIGGAFTLVRNSPELTAMLADRSRVIFRALPDETLEIDPAAFVRARALAAPQAAFIHLTNEIHPTAALNDWTIKALDAANALGVKVCALNLATHKNAAEWAVVRPAIEKAAAEGHAIGVHVYLDGVTDAGAWDWLPLMREVGGLWVCTEFGYIRRIQEPHRGWRGRMTETELGVWAEINAQPLVEANVPILWFAWDHWGAEKEERETWCGCIVAAYVEDPNPKKRKDLGREVGKWIGDGLIVQRMLSEAVRVKWIGDECKHGPEPIEGQLRMFDSE